MATVYACDTCKHVFKTPDTARRHQFRTGHRGAYEVEHRFKQEVKYLDNFKLGVKGF